MSLFGYVLLLLYQRKINHGEIPQRCLYVDYCALNILLPPVVKAHSKAQDALSLALLPKLKKYIQC